MTSEVPRRRHPIYGDRTPTREECIRAAAKILTRAALRIHQERIERDILEAQTVDTEERPVATTNRPYNDLTIIQKLEELKNVQIRTEAADVTVGGVQVNYNAPEMNTVRTAAITATITAEEADAILEAAQI